MLFVITAPIVNAIKPEGFTPVPSNPAVNALEKSLDVEKLRLLAVELNDSSKYEGHSDLRINKEGKLDLSTKFSSVRRRGRLLFETAEEGSVVAVQFLKTKAGEHRGEHYINLRVLSPSEVLHFQPLFDLSPGRLGELSLNTECGQEYKYPGNKVKTWYLTSMKEHKICRDFTHFDQTLLSYRYPNDHLAFHREKRASSGLLV